jgi:hypothetical protein
MPTRFRCYDPEQPLLLLPDLREWLSEAAEWMDQARIGISPISLRGLTKVHGEWDLVCLSLNLRRMHGLQIG